jgi:hypothetical protein
LGLNPLRPERKGVKGLDARDNFTRSPVCKFILYSAMNLQIKSMLTINTAISKAMQHD